MSPESTRLLPSGVSAHPKFARGPLTVCPCPGVSIAPKGLLMVALASVMKVGVDETMDRRRRHGRLPRGQWAAATAAPR